MVNNSVLELMTEKLEALQRALVLETDASVRFKLKKEIEETEEALKKAQQTAILNIQNKTSNIMYNENSVTVPEKTSINIFVSYSSKDRDLREILVEGVKGHLTERLNYQYKIWTDNGIDGGANWKEQIDSALSRSKVALLLVDSNFAISNFIKKEELSAFFARKKEEYLIIPILLREYNFEEFEQLAQLQFFKTYHSEYGFKKPTERNKLLPFDKLGDDESTTDEQLNLYYKKLAEHIHTAVSHKFPK